MTFHDHFSKRADRYAIYRPHYPAELFAWIASLAPEHLLAWDCATGNGQAAQGLSHHFRKVIATDASKEQIKHAARDSGIVYCVATAEDPPLLSSIPDAITVAQALHWMHPERFFAQVRRILKP